MRKIINHILLPIILLLLSATLYIIQISLFHDDRNTGFYLLQDLAFIPIQVLLITVILNKFLDLRQKQEMLKKMNMVIGAFFSSTGIELISKLMRFHVNEKDLNPKLLISPKWRDAEFKDAAKLISSYKLVFNHNNSDMEAMKAFILERKEFLLRLLENANLLEHETFTDMLWAVFHVADELASRETLVGLPANDYIHLEGDFVRAYSLLIYEWLYYMNHLRNDYPYLYSLATRKNPFSGEAKVTFE